MDNLTNALYMAFSIFVFIFAVAISLMLFRKADDTAKVLLWANNKNHFMEKVDMEKLMTQDSNKNIPKLLTTRIVNKDVIIPVLYRYMIETITVKIYKEDTNLNNLDQMFFSVFEKNFEAYKAVVESPQNLPQNPTITNFDKEYKDLFAKKDSPAYLYDAPWARSQSLTQQRVEYYIHGLKGFINGVLVDYSDSLLAKDNGEKTYKEIIVEYPYNGVVTQELDYIGNQVYLENEVIREQVKSKNMEIIYIQQR